MQTPILFHVKRFDPPKIFLSYAKKFTSIKNWWFTYFTLPSTTNLSFHVTDKPNPSNINRYHSKHLILSSHVYMLLTHFFLQGLAFYRIWFLLWQKTLMTLFLAFETFSFNICFKIYVEELRNAFFYLRTIKEHWKQMLH